VRRLSRLSCGVRDTQLGDQRPRHQLRTRRHYRRHRDSRYRGREPATAHNSAAKRWRFSNSRSAEVAIITDRIDDCVLALLLLGRHDGQRVWKSFDWAAMERLHEKGLISDPVGRAKSVVLTDEGLEKAERLFRDLFETNP